MNKRNARYKRDFLFKNRATRLPEEPETPLFEEAVRSSSLVAVFI